MKCNHCRTLDTDCFYCQGSHEIGESKEAKQWYRVRKVVMEEAKGSRREAERLFRGLAQAADEMRRGARPTFKVSKGRAYRVEG